MGKKEKGEAKAGEGILLVATNKKARRDYEILNNYEAGMVLLGSEVKSVRAGGLNLSDSYVRAQNGELFLVSCHISPYTHSRVDAHDPLRERKLLLHRQEIEKLATQVQTKGLTLIPLQVYFKKGRLKIEIGVGKGKKQFDKREDVKKKEAQREMDRAFKHR